MIKQIGVYNGSQWDLQNIGASAENIILPNSQLGASTLNELLGKLFSGQDNFTSNSVVLTGSDKKLISSQVTKNQLECLLGCTSNIQNALDSVVGEVNPFSSKIEINSGTNIKTLLEPANYYCPNGTVAGTLSNAPWTDRGFNLLVFTYPVGSVSAVVHLAYPNTAQGYIKYRICADRVTWSTDWRSLATGEGDLSSRLTKATADGLYVAQSSLSNYYKKTQVDSKITTINTTTSSLSNRITTNTNNITTINNTLSNVGIVNYKAGTSSLAASTQKLLTSVSLSKGCYMIAGQATFAANSSGGYRQISVGHSGDTDNYGISQQGQAGGAVCCLNSCRCVELTATTTVGLYAQSQVALNINNYNLNWMRIK